MKNWELVSGSFQGLPAGSFWGTRNGSRFLFRLHPLAKADEFLPTASQWAPGVFLWDTLTSYSKLYILLPQLIRSHFKENNLVCHLDSTQSHPKYLGKHVVYNS